MLSAVATYRTQGLSLIEEPHHEAHVVGFVMGFSEIISTDVEIINLFGWTMQGFTLGSAKISQFGRGVPSVAGWKITQLFSQRSHTAYFLSRFDVRIVSKLDPKGPLYLYFL